MTVGKQMVYSGTFIVSSEIHYSSVSKTGGANVWLQERVAEEEYQMSPNKAFLRMVMSKALLGETVRGG